MNSPLQLKHIEFTEILIREQDKGRMDHPYHITPHIQVGFAENNKCDCRIQIQLKTDSDQKKPFAYQVQVQVTGYFEIHPEFPDKDIEPVLIVNGTSLLYGSIREMLLSTTARFSKGSLMLPTMDFRSLIDKKEKI